MGKTSFILTKDSELAAQLRAANFTFIRKDSEGFDVFLNDGTYAFEESNRKKAIFTNMFDA